jgi:hypothetical protein
MALCFEQGPESNVPSLRDSPHEPYPTRHCRAGLQAVPSLRDRFRCGIYPGLKPPFLYRNVSAGLKTRSPGLKSGAGTYPPPGTREAAGKFANCEQITALMGYKDGSGFDFHH